MWRPSQWVARLTQLAVGAIEVLLGLRFLFRLLDGDSSRLFISWLYDNTHAMVKPWLAIFPVPRVGGFTFELPTLVAMVVYGFVAYLILMVIGMSAGQVDAASPKRRFSISWKAKR